MTATKAFESLRASNYLAMPFKEALQTLLLLSYVLQNDMKPQAAWVLQGSTIRLALCLGLHKQTNQSRNPPIPSGEARLLRYVPRYLACVKVADGVAAWLLSGKIPCCRSPLIVPQPLTISTLMRTYQVYNLTPYLG